MEADARSTSRSAVSRRFVRATETALAELLARDLSNLKVAAMMVDGLHIAEHLMVVALAITTDGRKVPVGLYEGDTENTTVVTALLADLVDRGLDTTGGVLFVLDGATALTKAVRKVFGSAAPSFNGAPCTSAGTWPTTYPSGSGSSSTASWSARSPTPTPTWGCGPPGSWRPPCNAPTRRPRPASGKDWRRCSPSAGSACPRAWNAR